MSTFACWPRGRLLLGKLNRLAEHASSPAGRRSMSHKLERLRFDGQTAIVTGAGRGLGREYALLLASRGANVVVNDPGLAEGAPGRLADLVVDEIAGTSPRAGKAIANYESVAEESGAKKLVGATLERFGRVDILINNAGILRDRSFAKMSLEEWDEVLAVHLRGSFLVSHACWQQMRKQEYGKIVMTSSTSGLHGNFGQANYSAAKMGLVGLSNTLAIEGRRSNIHCNAVVPIAATSMTRGLLPQEALQRFDARYVAPLVAWLCHKECEQTGAIYSAAGQWFGRYQLLVSRGKHLSGICESGASLEQVASHWQEIASLEEGAKPLEGSADQKLGEMLLSLEQLEAGQRSQ